MDNWQPGGNPPTLSMPVDAVVVGTATGLHLPPGDASITSPSAVPLQPGDFPDATYRLVIHGEIDVCLAMEGPFSIDAGDPPWIRWPEPTAIAVGFHDPHNDRPALTVPPSPDGLATAVTAAGQTHSTTGPERSHPGFRPPTPTVTFGDESIPAALTPDADSPTIRVPATVIDVLVAAPLAYYLGASLAVGDGRPHLESDAIEYTFEARPTFVETVSRILRGVVDLDTRLRTIPGESGRLVDGPRADELASASPSERVAYVMDASLDTLPRWPLSTYINADIENGRYLPYLLDRLSLVYPAAASALDPQALLRRCLDEFYRGNAPTIDAVEPSLTDSHSHAWLGDGTPVDAYTLRGGEPSDRPSPQDLRIDVVCNAPEMAAEQDVAAVYRQNLQAPDVDVRLHQQVSTSELAAIFERASDLVHFIGHCEIGGIVCPDGPFAAENLAECGATAVVLNACGSYYEGFELVRAGATVCAVTLRKVLDDQAVTLGTTFADLLANGFAFDRALSLARGEIIVGQDYVVVGDGTYRLCPPQGPPGLYRIRDAADGFTVQYEVLSPDWAGRRYVDPITGEDRVCGEQTMATVDRSTICDILARRPVPVRFDGGLEWSPELADRLRARRQQS